MAGLSLKGISSAFDALSAEADALKALSGTALAAGIVDLKEKIFNARMAQLGALERISQLEQQVMEFESWQSESQRYQAMQFEPGVTVYVEKNPQHGAHNTQHYCAQCYANRKIRVLQATGMTQSRRAQRTCHECQSTVAYGSQAPLPRVQTRYDPFGN